MSDFIYRKIEGRTRIFDNHGTEYDQYYKPFLKKPDPAQLAKLREMKKEAIARSKTTELHKLPPTHRDEISRLRDRIPALEARIHDCGCVKTFYLDCLDPALMTEWLDRLDKQMDEIRSYRNHLINSMTIADSRIDQVEATIHSANDEIDQARSRIRVLENESKPPRETEKKPLTAEQLAKKLDPRVVESFIAQGISLEQIASLINA